MLMMVTFPSCMFSKRGGHVKSRDKLNTLYLHLQKTHNHQIKQGTDLKWEAPIYKATWPFDHLTNLKSRDDLKNLFFHCHKSCDQ